MIIDSQTLLVFIPLAAALIITPGADMIFCLGQGMKSGPGAGISASLGIATGALINTFVAAAGLAALIKTYPLAFEVIRWTGVVYLVWLGLKLISQKQVPWQIQEYARTSLYDAWKSGVIVNLLNPKFSIFILAVIPQFINPDNGSPFLQFMLLGSMLNFGGTIVNALVGTLSGKIAVVVSSSQKVSGFFQILTGFIFFGLAARLAFDQK